MDQDDLPKDQTDAGLVEWFARMVKDGKLFAFGFIAITEAGTRVDYISPGCPTRFDRGAVEARSSSARRRRMASARLEPAEGDGQ